MKTPLAQNTVIDGRFTVVKEITQQIKNQIIYCCTINNTDTKVMIREFYPDYAVRKKGNELEFLNACEEELNEFIMLSKMGSDFSSLPVVIKTVATVEDNNTCYAVCEYSDGEDLKTILTNPKYEIPEDSVRKAVITLLKLEEALLKNGLLHKKIYAKNIFITKDGYIKLFEFEPVNAGNDEKYAVKVIAMLAYYMLTGVYPIALKKSISVKSGASSFLRLVINIINTGAENETISGFLNKVQY